MKCSQCPADGNCIYKRNYDPCPVGVDYLKTVSSEVIEENKK